MSLAACALWACSSDTTTNPGNTITIGPDTFKATPCSQTGTLSLAVATAARVDCSNGGTTLTLAGNGASYIILAQFAVDLVPDTFVEYRLFSGTAISASTVAASRARPTRVAAQFGLTPAAPRRASSASTGAVQRSFTGALQARARRNLAKHAWPKGALASSVRAAITRSSNVVPTLNSTRTFRVVAPDNVSYTSATATLTYIGQNVLVYLDNAAPTNGFTPAQLQAFGVYFDQTLYPIDTAAFGPPSDIDQNGHVIMLMSPSVNALTTTAQCQTEGYVAGYFNGEDLGGGSLDPNSNQGEIFYSIVPDPNGQFSCAHTTDDVGLSVPSTFLHELQHLISFSQHVVVHNGSPEFGWLDEGLSIVAEELGSLYYEQKCPGTACRTDPSQIFPDSSQGFVDDFLFDSYQYALLPDTASVTLHSDSENGFSWRGGDWLLMRWLGDQLGTGLYKKLDQSSFTGVANIENTTGQPFTTLFANWGLALYTDSLPGLPRTTAPAVNRFVTRNVKQLWDRLFVTSDESDIPVPDPLFLFPVSSDSTVAIQYPGTSSYWRLDTPSNAATVSIQFSGPAGVPFPATLKPQLAVFRLPAGQ